MVAHVFFRKEVAQPRLEALKEEAGIQAENYGLKDLDWWWEYRGDDIVFVFARGDKGIDAAHRFYLNCKYPGSPYRAEWVADSS
jgi:hypothetical protein